MKESTKIRLFAIAAALILGMFGCVFGQTVSVNRFDNRPDVVSIMNTPLEFGSVSGDVNNTRVGILKDIISKDTINYRLYVFFPKGTSPTKYDFVMKFDNGQFVKFDRCDFKEHSGYAEYVINKESAIMLSDFKVEWLLFRCDSDAKKNPTGGADMYFKNFMQICNN